MMYWLSSADTLSEATSIGNTKELQSRFFLALGTLIAASFCIGFGIYFMILDIPLIVKINFIFIPLQFLAFWLNRKNYVRISAYAFTFLIVFYALINSYILGTAAHAQWIVIPALLPAILIFSFTRKEKIIINLSVITLMITKIILSQLGAPIITLDSYVAIEAVFTGVIMLAVLIEFALFNRTEKLISDIREANLERLEKLSYRDTLTGVGNRHYAKEFFEKKLKREDDFPCFFCLIDVDNFKSINDTFGHDSGDIVLRILGDILSRNVRQTDMVCRWGGEEFLVVMPGCGAENGLKIMENIRHDFENENIYTKSGMINATLTGGADIMIDSSQSIDEFLRILDANLYEGKRSGKNRIIAH